MRNFSCRRVSFVAVVRIEMPLEKGTNLASQGPLMCGGRPLEASAELGSTSTVTVVVERLLSEITLDMVQVYPSKLKSARSGVASPAWLKSRSCRTRNLGFGGELTRFEQLAVDADLTRDELRGILRSSISAKVGTPRRLHQCARCYVEFELSDRRSRDLLAQGEPLCRLCRADVAPGLDIEWMRTLPPDVLDKAVAALATLAA